MPQIPPTPGPYIIRNAEDLTEALFDYFVMLDTGVTDLSVGSVTRTELEAFAQLAEQFYVDQATALQDSIAQSAFSAFNFTPLPAEPATGGLVFVVDSSNTLSSPVSFNAGSIWIPDGMSITFVTTVDFSIPANTAGHWHVPAKSTVFGSTGNLVGGAPGQLQFSQSGVSVYSEDLVPHGDDVFVSSAPTFAGFQYGQDPETPVEMRNRFTQFLNSLHRSTPTALEYGASLAKLVNTDGSIIEKVKTARCIDVNIDNTIVTTQGHAWIYIYNGTGGTSFDLVSAAQRIIEGQFVGGVFIPGYKAAGIDTIVYPAPEYSVNIGISVKPVGYLTALAVSSAFLTTAVQQAVQDYFNTLAIGGTMHTSAILKYIVSIPGILSAYITSIAITPPVGPVVTTIADYTPAGNGIVRLNTGQPTVLVLS